MLPLQTIPWACVGDNRTSRKDLELILAGCRGFNETVSAKNNLFQFKKNHIPSFDVNLSNVPKLLWTVHYRIEWTPCYQMRMNEAYTSIHQNGFLQKIFLPLAATRSNISKNDMNKKNATYSSTNLHLFRACKFIPCLITRQHLYTFKGLCISNH